jgi:hypothetical protein
MIKLFLSFLVLLLVVSCSPTSWLKLDIISPAEFTFPDTGKITILNASYLPSVLKNKSNLITQIPENEQYIFDTLIITNLFNGLFSVLNESPNEYLRNADYEEIRTIDTSNFSGPLANAGVDYLCKSLDTRFLVSFEYYEFNRSESKEVDGEYWQKNLEIPYKVIWRIYNIDGVLLHQFFDTDTYYWVENYNAYPLPELPDALREVFFATGEKFAKRISPYWITISRAYYLLSKAGNDISLDRDQLLILKDGKRKKQAFKACYNLAILSESEDKLQEAIDWLNKANEIYPWEEVIILRKKLEKRMNLRPLIDFQSGRKSH